MAIKKPSAFPLSHGLKRPREKDEAHLKFIRGLPCLICGSIGEAAHVRYGSNAHGKRETGAGEKPSDKYVVPLCPDHHRNGKDSQHASGERRWWQSAGIDPIVISALLFQVSGDEPAARLICENARQLVQWGGSVR